MKRRSNIKNLAAALLVVAKEIDAVDEVQRSIKLVLELLKKDAQFRAFMQSKRFTIEQKTEVIKFGLEDVCNPLIQELLIIEIDQNPTILMRDLSYIFDAMVKDELNIVPVEAHVADELSVDELAYLQKTLEETIGKDTELDLKIDPNLLGGIKLRIENTFLDASIKNKMDNLRRELLQ
ncbi:MAG: ATP synthase F1 subunit delta [Candidatus Neomarinimicrobiota bacterium]